MEITIEKVEGKLVAKPEGRLDSEATRAFEAKLSEYAEQKDGTLIIDFSSLAYISSAGLRSVLILAKAADNASCQLHLASLSKDILDIFQTTGFHNIVPIHDTVQDAINSLT